MAVDTPHSFSCTSVRPLRLDVGPAVGAEFTSVLSVLGRPRTSADAFNRRYVPPRLIGVDLASIHYVGTAADGKRTFVFAARGMRGVVPRHCLRKLGPKDRRQMRGTDLREPLICSVGGGGACGPLARFRRYGIFGSAGGVNGRATVEGLVPDGVRAVRVTYGRSTRAFPVAGNFFSFRVAVDVPQAASPDRIEWEMDDGSVRDATP